MPTSMPVLAGVVFGLAVIVGAVVLVRVLRRGGAGAGARHAEVAGALGLSYTRKGPARVHHPLLPLPGIPKHGDIKHVMTGPLDGRRALTAFEHRYIVSTGNAVIPVQHTVYVVDAPPWPSTTIRRRNAFGRLLRRLGARGSLELENNAFNHAIKVKTTDETFALMLLGPDLQAFVLEKPRVTWHVHPGVLALVYSGGMRAHGVAASLDRLSRFIALVPEELAAWTPDTPSPG